MARAHLHEIMAAKISPEPEVLDDGKDVPLPHQVMKDMHEAMMSGDWGKATEAAKALHHHFASGSEIEDEE